MTKLKNILLCSALLMLFSCKSGQMKQSSMPQAGLFKITVLYPAGEDKTFNMDYYEKKHMPMLAGFIGKNLKFYEIDKGISGRTANDKAPFMAIGYFYVTDVTEYNKSIAANRDAVMNDIRNYTNIQPMIQISEVRKIGHAGE